MKVVLFCGGLGMRMRDGVNNAPEADGDDRRAPDAVARHALLRAFRPHRFRALPRVRRLVRQGLLPELRRDPVQRLRAGARRPGGQAVQDRHLRLADHVRRHRPELADRRAAAAGPPVRRGRADVPGQLRGRAHQRPAAGHDHAVRGQPARRPACSRCRRSRPTTWWTSARTG